MFCNSDLPVFPLPTYRLSPKNQVTLPRDARSLAQVSEGGVVCGVPGRSLQREPGKLFPLITLMTVDEVTNRETAMRAAFADDQVRQFQLINQFNAGLKHMAVDGQRRIVLPPHFVEYLGVDRDLMFICTNTTVHVWNPEHYLAWRGEGDDEVQNILDRFMV